MTRTGSGRGKPGEGDIELAGDPATGFLLKSREPLGHYPPRISDHLIRWAESSPDRTFVAERSPDGGWSTVGYRRALESTMSIGQALIERGVRPERPVMLLSENSIDHALLQLGAMHAGIPVAPISPAYSLASRDHAKLRHVFEVVRPGMVFVSSMDAYARALGSLDLKSVEVVSSGPDSEPCTGMEELRGVVPGPAIEEAFSKVGPDTVAKILFTSGSTDVPKGVINTHRMMCSNQQMMAHLWPFLADHPPVLLDWLPWNHTFGGNHNFNMVLRNGGTLYIDEGKPVPGAIEATLANLREVSPTIYLNVPRGFSILLPYLQADRELAECFFRRLDMVFSAAAALPQPLFDAILALSREVRGEEIPIGSGWGATETSPLNTGITFDTGVATSIGLPAPGVELKMVPNGSTFELRVRGPHVTPGYYARDDLSRVAFDEDGFYMIGDAGKFLDPADPAKGLVFDGRITEDFKLTTGTWVQVGRVRMAAIEAASPLLQDAVVCGHGRDYVALLAWPDVEQCRRVIGRDVTAEEIVRDAEVAGSVRGSLREYNARWKGSSTRIARVLLMSDPPDMDAGEITDKGYINQRACLERRAELVDQLFAEPPAPGVIVL